MQEFMRRCNEVRSIALSFAVSCFREVIGIRLGYAESPLRIRTALLMSAKENIQAGA
jgi:hypothetical protein